MKLRELEASLIRLVDIATHEPVDFLERAQGLFFLCPKCYRTNGGKVGTHAIICWFSNRGVPDDLDPKPGRWVPEGTGLDDITFIGPAAASVLLTSGCGWHGFIRHGDAVDC